MSNEIEIAPLRRLDDFLLESARFQIPNYKNLDKWSNRVCSNLLYYQTNYFFMAIMVVLFVGCVHPAKMLREILAIGAIFGLLHCYVRNCVRSPSKFLLDHQFISSIVILSCAYFVVYLIFSLQLCLYGLMLAMFLIFIHASMRLRNLRNKVVNKIEAVGVKKTPMGLFLEAVRKKHSDFLKRHQAKLQE